VQVKSAPGTTDPQHGTCQVDNERADEIAAEIVETIAAAERLTV
jgi:hypothetical protein